MTDVRICFDRVIPDDYQPARSTFERVAKRGLHTIDPDAPQGRTRLALGALKMWENGTELKCRFLDGDSKQKKGVEAKARMWEDYANITFKFVKSQDAQIRISFVADTGSWSALGTDCLIESYFPQYQPTMNFGWLQDDTPDGEYERVVVHEFGHALGAIHEHQNPDTDLKWNKAEVYRVFSGPPNYWDKPKIDFNILDRYSKEHLNYTRFDGDSIMLYAFPAALFENHKGTKENEHLSVGDKKFIAKMYPKRETKA